MAKTYNVYGAYYNADMTEGRGPMKLKHLFANEQDAKDYIDMQPGVMGRRNKWSEEKYGDWKVEKLMVVIQLRFLKDIEEVVDRDKALSKLTKRDKEVLGLSD